MLYLLLLLDLLLWLWLVLVVDDDGDDDDDDDGIESIVIVQSVWLRRERTTSTRYSGAMMMRTTRVQHTKNKTQNTCKLAKSTRPKIV